MIQSWKFNCNFVNNENTNRVSLKINVGCIPPHPNAHAYISLCKIVVLIPFLLSFFHQKLLQRELLKNVNGEIRKENENLLGTKKKKKNLV